MGKGIREVMTSNPCTIDADKPVSYAAKMMRDEGEVVERISQD
jgi:CBS domain-containing protein